MAATNLWYCPTIPLADCFKKSASETERPTDSQGDQKMGWFTAAFRPASLCKKIEIRPVFLCSLITFCLFLLSSNSIHKECDNNPPILRQIKYSYKKLNDSITISDIKILNPLNANLPALSHTHWLVTVLVRTTWSENRSIYHSSLSYSTMATKLTNG